MIALRYTIEPEDYFAFSRWYSANVSSVKKRLNVMRAVLFIAGAAVMILLAGRWETPTMRLIFCAIFLVILVPLVLYMPKSIRRVRENQIRKQMAAGNAPEFFSSYKTTFDDDRLVQVRRDGHKVEMDYEEIALIGEDGGALYLYDKAMSAVLLPASAFGDAAQRARLLTLMRGH